MSDRGYDTVSRWESILLIWLLLVLLAIPGMAHDARVLAASLTSAACTGARAPYAVWVVNAASATSCNPADNSTFDAHCCCQDGSWAACGDGGPDGTGYDTVQDEGTPLAQEDTLAFYGNAISCVDVPGTRTSCTVDALKTAGVSGGQTAIGGTASGNDLTMKSNSADASAATFTLNDATNFSFAFGASEQAIIESGRLVIGGSGGLCSGLSTIDNGPCIANNGSDRLWHDTDGDGVVDAGETFIDGYDRIADEGSNLTYRHTLNFTGAGVSCADNAGSTRTDCTIAGGGASLTVEEVDTSPSVASVDKISFDQADGFVVTDNGSGDVRIDFSAAQHAGHLSGIQTYTSGSGTYTVPAGVTRLVVQGVGGGAGGGTGNSTATNCGAGGGGGAGGYFEVTLSSLSSSYSYAVGAGGGSAANGSNTTFGSYTANGGTAGASCNACSVSGASAGGAGGAASGTSAIASYGQSGSAGMCLDVSTGIMCIGGTGGSSELGDGGPGYAASTTGSGAGTTANGEGGGGGGGCGTNTAATNAGGSGAAGVIRIYEYSDEDAVVTSGFAPYGELDFDRPPSSCYLCDEFAGGVSDLTWVFGNQDSASVTLTNDMAYWNGGDTTNEWHGYCIDTATHTLPGDADQTFCVKVSQLEIDTTNEHIGIAVIGTGTVASPTEIEVWGPGNFSTDSINAASYTAWTLTGSAGIGSWTMGVDALSRGSIWLRGDFTASSNNTDYYWSFDGKSWFGLGSSGNLANGPISWCIGGRAWTHGYIDYARLRTDADRTDCGSR